MTNKERFTQAYDAALRDAVKSNPDEYAYLESEVPGVVAKMVPAFATGNASIGPASRAAARACGIKPTLSAIKTFLNS